MKKRIRVKSYKKNGRRVRSHLRVIPWIGNIESKTLKNNDYRRVIETGQNEQLVLMSLKPGEAIGDEIHPHTDQFIRVEKGRGKAVFNENKKYPIKDGSAMVITAGTYHNIINTSKKKPLKLYTVYSPPHHPPKTLQRNKPLHD